MQGLSSAEAMRRFAQFGPNELTRATTWQRVRAIAEAFVDPMALMLLAAGLVYLAVGDVLDGVILLIALIPVWGVDVVLGARSRRALDALTAAVAPSAHVMRDGVVTMIPVERIVPGDVLVLGEGDIVHADATLERAEHVTVDEAHLTGESEPQARAVGASVHTGSRMITGHGTAVVTVTGARTELGRIAELVATTEAAASPLQHAIGRLVKALGIAAVGVAVLVFGIRIATGTAALAAFLSAVGLAMAAIPEEFPLVLTLYLSIGAVRLGKRGVLVRRLAAVEALGATTVICTDKTGTLTRGVFELDQHRAVDGDDASLLAAAVLACEVTPDDVLDAAIFAHAVEHGVQPADLHARWRLVADHELEGSGRHITHVWSDGERWKVVVKGALEGVLEHCPLTDPARAAIEGDMAQLAAVGMRVLAVASRDGTGPVPVDRVDADRDLVFRGLLGFRDPLRPEVPATIAACRAAGITVKLVTGDHALTARTIAELAGIPISDTAVVTGAQLAALPPAIRAARIQEASVFARIRPEQKFEIVDALTTSGEVVAMTGDGVNDAPALRRASIGISMGRGATEVARAAAGLVLLENDLGALVSTIREGRRIYANLQRAFLFLVAFHIPIITLAVVTPLLGIPLLFLPVHLVWLELIVHPVAALVFEAEPALVDAMQRPPRSPRAPLLPRALLIRSVVSGSLIAAGTLGLYVAWLGHGEEVARGAAMTAVICGGVALTWAERALHQPWRVVPRPTGAQPWLVIACAAATLPLAMTVPLLRQVLHLAFPGPGPLLIALAVAVVAVAWRARGVRAPNDPRARA